MLSKIKICHVVTTLDVGGMENGIVNLANNHDRGRFEIHISCLGEIGDMARRLKSDVGLHVLGEPEGFSVMRILRVAKFFMKLRPHIVHTHAWGGGSLYGILGGKLVAVPVIINGEHGSFFTQKKQLTIQRFLFRLCDYNLSVSETLKDRIVDVLGVRQDKITVIRNGVDTELFSGKYPHKAIYTKLAEEGFAVSRDAFRVFIVGSLKREKRQITLFKAVEKIYQQLPNGTRLNVFVIGDGPDREQLQRYTDKAGIQDVIFFLGRRSDVHELFALAHLLVSTSYSMHEGLSNVLLEAMSSGVPVVATDSIGSNEIIEDGLNGYLISNDDIKRLADVIQMLMMHPEQLRKLGDHARQTILSRFSLPRMVHAYEKLYISSLARR